MSLKKEMSKKTSSDSDNTRTAAHHVKPPKQAAALATKKANHPAPETSHKPQKKFKTEALSMEKDKKITKNSNDLYHLFIDELEDMHSSEKQIIASLPKLIELASLTELKQALSAHLEETRNQVDRIDEIFSILNVDPQKKNCEAMEGIIKEVKELVKNKEKSPLLDAAIIAAAQKVEHYEIASYGTLRSFAKNLDLDSKIADLLQSTLDEESAVDRKLTRLAEGSFFSSGVNKEAKVFCCGVANNFANKS